MQLMAGKDRVTGHDAVSRTSKARKQVVSTIQFEWQETCVSMQYLSEASFLLMKGGNPPITSDHP